MSRVLQVSALAVEKTDYLELAVSRDERLLRAIYGNMPLQIGTCVSAFAHALVLVVAFMFFSETEHITGALGAGAGGIEVSIERAGSASGSIDSVSSPQSVNALSVLEPEREVKQVGPPTSVESPADEHKEARAVQPLNALQSVLTDEAVTDAEPVESQLGSSPPHELAEIEAESKADEQPVDNQIDSAPPRDVEEIGPQLTAVAQPAEPRVVTVKKVKIKSALAQAPSIAGASGKSGSQSAPDVGSGKSTTAGGGIPSTVSYLAILRNRLEKHKEYPAAARARRLQGTVSLYFAIDRAGRVLNYHVQKSSGHKLLDRAAEAMIERAKPLPPMPENIHRPKLEIVVPVRFDIR